MWKQYLETLQFVFYVGICNMGRIALRKRIYNYVYSFKSYVLKL
jgi:hypothetical protein